VAPKHNLINRIDPTTIDIDYLSSLLSVLVLCGTPPKVMMDGHH